VAERAAGAWGSSVVVAACVGGELLLASALDGDGAWAAEVPRAILVTAMVGLAVVAIAVGLGATMGLAREVLGVRLIAYVPIFLTVSLAVVMLLEFHARARTTAEVPSARPVSVKLAVPEGGR
jgi:hypothetical protein